ncbi:MAG: MobA/MobL family protein [Planctomycetes bacterium]|nr:MobA/MobL family protein [Planctomycetota bacterium]
MRSYELHATAKQVARSSGRSSVSAAAYRSGTCLEDERTGIVHDYTKKQGVEHSQIYIPDNAPDWAKDAKDRTALRSKLWNASEAKENRSNSTTAHELEVAFPSEFNAMQRREAGDAISREIMRRYNVAVDISFHAPNKSGDERNSHSHILFTTRGFDENTKDGWAKTKFRDLSKDTMDKDGNPYLDREGNKTTRGKLEILSLREFTAQEMNRIAEREKLEVHTEHLSFEKRGIDREPSQHLGANASQIEREGKQSERGDINRDIQASNDNLRLLDEQRKKAEYHRSQRQKINKAFEKRQEELKELTALHEEQRDNLQKEKENLIKQRLEDIKEQNRSKWAAIYKQQEQETKNFEQSTSSAFGRLRYFIKNKDRLASIYDEKGHLSGAFQSVLDKDLLSTCLNNRHEKERKTLASYVSSQKQEMYRQINEEHARKLDALKTRGRDNQSIVREMQTKESKKRAADIANGKAKEEFDRQKKAQESREAFNKEAQKRPPETKKEINAKRYYQTTKVKLQQQKNTGNDNNKKDSGVKKDFTKAKEKRAFRFVNDNRPIEKTNSQETDNEKKDSDVKKEFNKFRFLPNHQEKEKKSGRFTGRSTNKEADKGRKI